MPAYEPKISVNGTIVDVFAHRFVIQSPTTKILADLGPRNAEKLKIKSGDEVQVTGEQKPSELKIQTIVLNGEPIALDRKEPRHGKPGHHRHDHEEPVDPQIAIVVAKNENITIIGKPHRKPKHFEILGKNAQGDLIELHVELDGTLRKTKPVQPNDDKWADELSAA